MSAKKLIQTFVVPLIFALLTILVLASVSYFLFNRVFDFFNGWMAAVVFIYVQNWKYDKR